MAVSLQLSPKHPTLLHCISLWRPDLAISGEKSRPFPQPKFCSCKVRIHATEILQLKLMGNVAFVCISKNIPLNPYPVILYKIVGSAPPHQCKKIRVRRGGRIVRRCISLWRPDLAISGEKSRPFPQPKFCSCKVRIHATEILQLKLMGNVAFVCISKNIPLNPYPVILYKIVGSAPPHQCKKIRVRRGGRIGRR